MDNPNTEYPAAKYPITGTGEIEEFCSIVGQWYDDVAWSWYPEERKAFQEFCLEQNDWDCYLPAQWRAFRDAYRGRSAARAAEPSYTDPTTLEEPHGLGE